MFSIIIPTMQKDVEILNKLIFELDNSSLVDEILIIDNSTKGFLSNSKKVRVIVPKENLFVNPAWNLGVREAKNEIVGIFNDDILLPLNFIEEVNNFIQKTPDFGIIGLDSNYIRNYEKKDFETYPNNSKLTFKPFDKTIYTEYFGSAFFIKKENYYEIPKNIKVWCGDNYLLKKNLDNHKTNYEIIGAEIKHLKSMTVGNKKFEKICENDVYNYAKINPEFKKHSHYKSKRKTFLRNIFSLRNENKYKVLTVAGVKIKMKYKKPTIYDCFTFYNEFEMLDLRLNILDKYVDKFVLVEGNKTHAGKDKPFYFDKNKEKFEKFKNKIIHIKVSDFPSFENSKTDSLNNRWIYENFQRDAIMRGLANCSPDDIVIISDCDEIANPKAILKYKNSKANGIWQLNAISTYYYFNLINLRETPLDKIKIARYKNLIDPKQNLEIKDAFAQSKYGLPTYFRYTKGKEIKNGGWHFSYLMDEEKISQKIASIAEQHVNNENSSNIDNIKRKIAACEDIFEREGYEFLPVKLDKNFPRYIIENKEKYNKYILKENLKNWNLIGCKKGVKSFLQKIFSIKSARKNGRKQKKIQFLGIKFSFKKPITKKDKEKYINYVLNSQLDKNNYVSLTEDKYIEKQGDPKLIAFYLPQFHRFPENDNWFGRGFCEWHNVTKAVPQYTGHYQPHLPIDTGFYNLETTIAMKRQIELAKMYGIYGFAFYYYWFSGKKIMEKPILQFLADRNLNMPFFAFWTNEPWTRLWGGGKQNEVLYEQKLQEGDSKKFMEDMIPFMKDERYIKICNKPVLAILNPSLYPKETFLTFIKEIREIAKENGFKDLYIMTIRREKMQKSNLKNELDKYNMDAMFEFIPGDLLNSEFQETDRKIINKLFKGKIYNTEKYIEEKKYNFKTNCTLYKGLFPMWDNTARKIYSGCFIFESSPKLYKKWLKGCIDWTKENNKKDEQFIFINAWNEWAEGAHLEPDQKYGYAYLQATKEALEETKD